MAECIEDFDCPGNLVCFSDVTWSIKTGNETSFCDCDGFFGWKGDDCTDIGPQTIFWCITNIIVGILTTFGLFKFGLVPLTVFLSRNSLRRWSALTQTFICVNMFFLFRTIVSILFVLNVLDRDGYGDRYKNDMFYAPAPMPGISVGDKRGSLTTFVQGFTAISHIFNILASTNIALVWCDVAFKAKNLLVQSSPKFMRFRIFIRAIQVIYLTLYTLNFLVADNAFAWFAIASLRLILGTTYLLARRWFAQLSDTYNDQEHMRTSQMATIFHRISRVTFWIIAALGIVAICSFGIIGMSINASHAEISGREILKPGKINLASVLYAGLFSSYVIIALIIGWYLSTVLQPPAKTSKISTAGDISNQNSRYRLQSSARFTSNGKVNYTADTRDFEYTIESASL